MSRDNITNAVERDITATATARFCLVEISDCMPRLKSRIHQKSFIRHHAALQSSSSMFSTSTESRTNTDHQRRKTERTLMPEMPYAASGVPGSLMMTRTFFASADAPVSVVFVKALPATDLRSCVPVPPGLCSAHNRLCKACSISCDFLACTARTQTRSMGRHHSRPAPRSSSRRPATQSPPPSPEPGSSTQASRRSDRCHPLQP